MDFAVLALRFVLSMAFLLAGAGKLADPAGTRRAVIDFGIPTALAGPLTVGLPLAELATALALLAAASASWGAIGALLLLVLFSAATAINLALGRKPRCHCFGQLHSSPVGRSTLLRNGLLAAGAGFVMWQGPGAGVSEVFATLERLGARDAFIPVFGLGVLALVAVQGWFLMNIFRLTGRLLVRVEAIEAQLGIDSAMSAVNPSADSNGGLTLDSTAPEFGLSDLAGNNVTLTSLLAEGKPVLLVFLGDDTASSDEFLAEMGQWQREHEDLLTTVAVRKRANNEMSAQAARHGPTSVVLIDDGKVHKAYKARLAPSAVLVRRDATIATPLVAGEEAIRELLERALEASARALAAAKIGDPAPSFALADLSGNTVDVKDVAGNETLVLFWNPECGFCNQILAEVRAWEASKDSRPRLVVVSTGSAEANRAMGFQSPVVLDDQFEVARSFGAHGTPSAVLLDADGRLSSEVVLGPAEVLKLLRASNRDSVGDNQTRQETSSARS